MMKLFSTNKTLSKTYRSIIQSINNLEDVLNTLSDTEIKEKFNELKKNYEDNKQLINNHIIISFALTREVSKRVLQLRHYDTQILGGLILNEGKIIEMQTGEGKTLVATLPTVTNALTKKGVHIITVNDYLAQRDTQWIGQIYRFFDLSVGLVHDSLSETQKKSSYNSDVTYLTNNVLGFDFLKDSLAIQIDKIVQRKFHFCIIDEVDSVLIDEAKTPLIISKPEETNLNKFLKATEIIEFLKNTKDFEIDERTRNISLTEKGFERTKILLKIEDLYNITKNYLEKKTDYPWIYYILNALKAKYLYFQNIHYVLQNNEVVIVDESTGRLMPGRKWGEGLHEAIEIKEGSKKVEGTQNISSITYQNLFRLYPKISGMTGTAKTDELEFEETYNLPVLVIPTFKPMQRIDLPDLIYIDDNSKWNAVCKDVKQLQKIGRPVLIGTPTIESSDFLTNLLNQYNIKHQLLNARPDNLARESAIIAEAGRLKAVTLATNMAGRGTDILLGGNPEFQAKTQLKWIVFTLLKNLNKKYNLIEQSLFQTLIVEVKNNYLLQLIITSNHFNLFFEFLIGPTPKSKKFDRLILLLYKLLLKECKKNCQKEASIIKKLGGLYVIGTERHESRRIDNQLRGRAGRQGDPGTSRFYLSANDKLIRIFGGPQISQILKLFQFKDKPFQNKLVSRAITSSQQKVESINYEQRQNTNKYDENLEKQHLFILKLRQMILHSSNLHYFTTFLVEGLINDLIDSIKIFSRDKTNVDRLFEIPSQFYIIFNILNINISPFFPTVKNINYLRNFLWQQTWNLYNQIESEFWSYDENIFYEYQKLIFLSYIDLYWAHHLENINFIKESIGWEAYSQKDPLLRYLEKSEFLFSLILKNIRDICLLAIFSVELRED